MNIVLMEKPLEKPLVHGHPLFETAWVVDIHYFVICFMPHLRLTLNAYDSDETNEQGEQWIGHQLASYVPQPSDL